jgi:hypothetical protein
VSLPPFRRSSPKHFSTKVYPSLKVYPLRGPVFMSTRTHCHSSHTQTFKLSNTVHTTSIPPTNHDHVQIYFPFVSPFQIQLHCVRMFPLIHTELSFPRSFPN